MYKKSTSTKMLKKRNAKFLVNKMRICENALANVQMCLVNDDGLKTVLCLPVIYICQRLIRMLKFPLLKRKKNVWKITKSNKGVQIGYW